MVKRIYDSKLVRQCAPTLAGLKVGSFFCMDTCECENLCHIICHWNGELNNKGVFVRVLAEKCGRSFIYVYREDLLKELINKSEIQSFLSRYGYGNFEVHQVLQVMNKRINRCHCFPHEVGLLFGYPLEDVKGFIANSGKNCKYVGYWKVYGDLQNSLRLFNCFRQCFNVFNELFNKGYSLPMLTVAS